ncbi:ATP-binding protein, partial [Parasutterella excrementihominis]|uniref:ATP-binding protein n=1 Tax=Parasutterella excrementihominis TaxID=487175 RepID=UPI003AB81AD7
VQTWISLISACWRSVCLFRKNQLYRIASMFALGLCQSFKFILDSSDSFYQVDMGSGRKVGGTGLGLSICRGIMAAHGGKIWAEQNPKGGTVFKISLSL